MRNFSTRSSIASLATVLFAHGAFASSFICAEPGGKRLVEIDGNDVSPIDGKIALRIDGTDIRDRDGKRIFCVDEDDVRPGPAGVKLATFDGEDIRRGAGGKVMMNYHERDLCPTSADNRVYTIEGERLTKQQLVAGLYLLKPEMFTISVADDAAQKKAMQDAAAEQDKVDDADQVAGKWMMLNSNGIAPNLDKGSIVVAAKKGDAYPTTLDFGAGGGPAWQGVGHYALSRGEKTFWVAYGTPKTVALCVYEIEGGTLKGKWSPWYVDGDAKNTGAETLSGPTSLDGEFKITAASAPTTGAAYGGTVTIKPMPIVGTIDTAKPYSLVWTFGKVKVYGIGIRTGNQLFVASGAGPDLSIAKFKIENGSMTSDWFKFGSTEKGESAATTAN